MYNPSIPFDAEQINYIESQGLTLEQLKDFWTRFPDQDMESAIGGCKDELKAKSEGKTTPLDSELQDIANPSPLEVKANEEAA